MTRKGGYTAGCWVALNQWGLDGTPGEEENHWARALHLECDNSRPDYQLGKNMRYCACPHHDLESEDAG